MHQKTKKKVAIVGFAPSSRDLAPFNDPDWEIWGLNDVYQFIPRWDVWFQLHEMKWFYPEVDESVRDKNHYGWLKEQTKPVYMVDQFPEIPACIKYPKDEMVAKYGDYFCSSVSWMLALAIEMGYETIGVWGIDMAVSTTEDEYSRQRPSCEYFLGIAQGKGIEVIIPRQSELLKTKTLYGFEWEKSDTFSRKMLLHKKELQGQLAGFQQKKAEAQQTIAMCDAHINYTSGAIENNNYVMTNWD